MGTLIQRIQDVAAQIGVSPPTLKAAALEHGLAVKLGRGYYIETSQIEKLIEKCRVKPNPQDYSDTAIRPCGTSETARSDVQQALQAVNKLKQHSNRT